MATKIKKSPTAYGLFRFDFKAGDLFRNTEKFMDFVCCWGGCDKIYYLNNNTSDEFKYFSFEVSKEIASAVEQILIFKGYELETE